MGKIARLILPILFIIGCAQRNDLVKITVPIEPSSNRMPQHYKTYSTENFYYNLKGFIVFKDYYTGKIITTNVFTIEENGK